MKEYSKKLLDQESALIWIMSLSFIVLAFYCIHEGFTGSLPWLAAMVGFPWTAYGVSQAFYYRKSMKENTVGGIKYDTVMEEARRIASQYENAGGFDFSMFENIYILFKHKNEFLIFDVEKENLFVELFTDLIEIENFLYEKTKV